MNAPGGLIAHPLSLLALALLLANDHWAKARFAGLITGKLSDVAGLVLAPILLVATCELLRGRALARRRAMALAVVLVAACFALAKTLVPAAALYREAFGALRYPLDALAALLAGRAPPALRPAAFARDPTDLLALPAALLPMLVARRASVSRARVRLESRPASESGSPDDPRARRPLTSRPCDDFRMLAPGDVRIEQGARSAREKGAP